MRQQFLIYKNSKIAFSSEGKGSAIVLLHGFLENSLMWKDIVFNLSRRNRVICIDLLGHGNSDCLGYVHSMNEQAEVVKFVLDHLKLRRVTLIGHSMGGYVSLAFVEKYSKNVKGVCLVNSTSQADSEERKVLRVRAIKMAQTNYRGLVSMSITNLFSKENHNRLLKDIEATKKEALKTSVQAYVACTEGMLLRSNLEHVLASKSYKKLFIIGQKDSILNSESIKEEANRTNTDFIELSGGHMSHIENKIELNEALIDFIRK